MRIFGVNVNLKYRDVILLGLAGVTLTSAIILYRKMKYEQVHEELKSSIEEAQTMIREHSNLEDTIPILKEVVERGDPKHEDIQNAKETLSNVENFQDISSKWLEMNKRTSKTLEEREKILEGSRQYRKVVEQKQYTM